MGYVSRRSMVYQNVLHYDLLEDVPPGEGLRGSEACQRGECSQNLGVGRRDPNGGGPGRPGGALSVPLQHAVAAHFNVRVNVKSYGYCRRCAVVD